MSKDSILDVILRQLRVSATIFLGPLVWILLYEMPLHDALSIKVFMSKILMVCVDHNLLTEENIAKFFWSFDNWKKFSFYCSISNLCRLQFTTVKCYWMVILTDDCTKLVMTGISMNMKWFIKVWVWKKYFVTDYCFHFIKGLLFNICPLERDIFGCKTC